MCVKLDACDSSHIKKLQHAQYNKPTKHPCRASYIYTQVEGSGTSWVSLSSLVLPWASPPSADRATALLLLASEAWVGVSSRLRTPLSTGAANERRAIHGVPKQTRKTEQTKGKRKKRLRNKHKEGRREE